VVLTALYDEEGALVGFSNVTRDISERKQVEMQLELTMQSLRKSEEKYRTLANELEIKVAERTSQLEAANREMEAFTYSVSHDLRAPLRAIDGFSRVIVMNYSSLLDDDGKDYLGRIRESSQQMGELIDGLLELSRLSKADVRLEKVDLSGLAKDLAANLKEREMDRQVEFRIQDGITATGDSRLLRTALQNLFENAWKFTGKKDKAVIEFGETRYEGQVAYFVKDNGAGFDPTFASKLFGAFQRLHTAEEFPGIGIGLATVQKILRRHGGRIWAISEVDKGATFYFSLV
jgi:light-regulated signal transduction histidine kinase (bacteriophytochrome)